jgi:leucyl-tRNA synthetase
MIQGTSEKIYRLIARAIDQPHETICITNKNLLPVHINIPGEIKNIYASAEICEDNELFASKNVPIEFTRNSELNIEAYLKWLSDEDANAAFVTEGGYWYQGKFHKQNDLTQVFKTRPEVEKMSKSKWNVVSPDDICQRFGADTLRLYEMFLGPLEQSKPWNTNGITGVAGFLKKLWRLFYQGGNLNVSDEAPTKAELKSLHKTIKKITEDIERFSFNTSVSNFMICVNELTELKCNKRSVLEPLLILISPYAPHIAEELYAALGHATSISTAPFPQFNESHLIEDSFMYPISFNGKMRLNIELPAGLTVPEIEKEVMGRSEVQKFLNGASPKKIIIVPKKIVNIVH